MGINRVQNGSLAAALIAAAFVVSGCVYHTERTERETPATTPVQPQQVTIVLPMPSATPPPVPTIPAPTVPAPNQPNPTNGAPLPIGATPDASMVTTFCSVWIPPGSMYCPRSPNPRYVDEMTEAINRVQREHPQVFNGNTVVDAVTFYNWTFRNLYEMGFCANVDGNEVAVAAIGNTNYRENYQIISSAGQARRAGHVSACSR